MAGRLNPGSPATAIIGAGWAGLAAAIDLVDAGHAVTVFEAGRVPGGRARSVRMDGLDVDNGQHLLIGAYRETLALLAQIGVKSDTVLRRLPLQVIAPPDFALRLPPWPAPLHVLAGLLTARVPWREKWAAARFMRDLERQQFRLPRDIPVAQLLDAHRQHGRLRRHLWDALCVAALNTPPAVASAQVFLNVLRDSLAGQRDATDFLVPRVPLGAVFAEPAVAWLRRKGASVALSTRIGHLRMTPDGWQLTSSDQDHGPFHNIIHATAPQHLAALLPEGCSPAQEKVRLQLNGLDHEPIATVYARYPDSVRLPVPILQLPTTPGQWVFDRGQFGGPPGLLAHVLSAHGAWEKETVDTLAAQLHASLGKAIGPLPEPRACRRIIEHRATFACRAGLQRLNASLPWPGLWLAGDHVAGDYPATLEGALRSGRTTARLVIDATRRA